MKAFPGFSPLLSLLAFALASPTAHADPSGSPGPDRADQYPVPYGKPSVDAITAVLQRILSHVDMAGSPTLVDESTKLEVTDLSKPVQRASARLGGYPMGVFHSGALLAAEVTGDKRFTDYTAVRLQFIADHLAYFQAQEAAFGPGTGSVRNFLDPANLDSCGAWGAALVQARLAGVGPDLRPVIDRWADYVSHGQYRLSDGTLARPNPQPDSVWADDMYMSVPFLAAMGKMTGDTRYYDDAARQVLQISDRLFIWSKGLYAHAWSAGNSDYNPEFHWGRANGWCDLAMCDLLDVLPQDHPARPAILKILRSHIKALAALQSGRGLWHQLLDHEDSFLETSCTAMFTYTMAHAVNRGWISSASYGPVALVGWSGVASKVGADGSVDGVCIGTNYASDILYYYHRPARDDPHGYGPVLLAGSEMIRLAQNDRLDIHMNPNGGCMIVTEKK
jgi:unsaturated rhamnogalacturonyl hydrolase